MTASRSPRQAIASRPPLRAIAARSRLASFPTVASTLLVFLLLVSACGVEPDAPDASEGDPSATGPDARTGAGAAETALAETLRRATRRADEVEDALRPLPLLRPNEEAALRRFPNSTHVSRARALGARAADTADVRAHLAEGRLIQLEDSTRHWIVRERGGSPAYVVPHTRELLREIGERFQERLAEMGIPPYRLEITSALRTTARQAALRRTNANAAAGTSSHEFGTTVDLAYSAYAPPAETPPDLVADGPEWMDPYLHRIAAVTLESVSARKSRELQAILGQVLREMQDEGLVLVILERLQPVYHITVAEAMADR